jgi:hypothetical protein
MFELQQTLPEMTLSPLPDNCDLCVQLSYELFLAGESGEGWLEDPVLLASFENFFKAHLGPHFPPDTIVGFRRSATPYYVAHSVALTAAGDLWRWTATEPRISGPEVGGGALTGLLAELTLENIAPEYLGPCLEGSGFETLYLKQGEEVQIVELVCPELSLPLPLLPLYLQLNGLAEEKTAEDALPQPEPTVPLESVLYYQREDGSVLTLFANGRARATTDEGLIATAELAEDRAVETALALTDSGILQLGVIQLVSGEAANILIARGLDGVYEIGWNNASPSNLEDFIAELDDLMEGLLENAVSVATETPTPDPEATPGTVTPAPTPTPVDDVTPQATATP